MSMIILWNQPMVAELPTYSVRTAAKSHNWSAVKMSSSSCVIWTQALTAVLHPIYLECELATVHM